MDRGTLSFRKALAAVSVQLSCKTEIIEIFIGQAVGSNVWGVMLFFVCGAFCRSCFSKQPRAKRRSR